MNKREQPSFREFQSITLLVHECCELGIDPLAWRLHLLAGLRRILNVDAILFHKVAGILSNAESPPAVLSFVESGFSQTMLKMFDEYTQHFDARKCVLEQALLARAGLGEVITGRAEDLLPGRIWKSSALYNDYLQRIDFQALLGSRYLAKNGMAHSILLHRGSDLTDFTERERRLLDYCFLHISSLLGIRLADFGEPSLIDRLRPRERDVLCLFLRQMSERQVATALGISPHTVRDHAKRLNRFFQVKSRDQLVATTIKFLPLLELDLKQRGTVGS